MPETWAALSEKRARGTAGTPSSAGGADGRRFWKSASGGVGRGSVVICGHLWPNFGRRSRGHRTRTVSSIHSPDPGCYARRVDRSDGEVLVRGVQDPPRRARIESRDEDQTFHEVGRRIVCAACRHPIATDADRIAVNGAHEHTCVNPHGLVFHIACFGAAPGCRATGVPTTDFTWFSGFAWCYALCGGCGALLGWRYRGLGNASFFGLIRDRIVSVGQSDA